MNVLLAVVLGSEFGDDGVGDVVVVVHDLVDDPPWGQLDDTVRYRLDELVVMAGEEDIALEDLQRVVEGLDALQVEVVRGAIEYQHIGILEHHTRDHAAHLLTPGEYGGTLEDLLTREEHTPEEALEVDLIGVGGELREPLHEVHIRIEVLRVV